jgi:hypothetical protein
MEENDTYLMHVGVAHDENPPGPGSGRYPWGSGDKAFQRPRDFLDRVHNLEAQGKGEQEIAEALGILNYKNQGSPTRLRAAISIATNEERLDLIREVRALDAKGIGATEGARILGLPNESSFRSYLKEGSEYRSTAAKATADSLAAIVKEKGGMVVIPEGTAENFNISKNRLEEALELLYYEGYDIRGRRVPYPTNPSQGRTIRVLCPPGTPKAEEYKDDKLHAIFDEYISHDGVTLKKGFEYPASMDSSRLMVRFGDQGGEAKDGLVEIRPGVKDLDIGYHYAQVRIMVDGTHYIKGMAVYGQEKDFPKGVDVIFNTNKKTGTPIMDPDPDAKQVLKNISNDPSNPFKSSIKEHGGQSYWTDDKGVEHLSLINRREVEGGWDQWSKELPSQFLSKQPIYLINKQLNLTEKQKREELDEIKSLTNNTVKKILLNKFAQTADGQAVSLKAASLPGQRYQVILPLTTIKDDEIYAPNFKQGDTVSLIRFPHAGLFEIPRLRVNNNIPEGDRVITKQGKDAVGISAATAKILSGADFDGDTVLVIPHSSGVTIKNREPLEGLKNFDIELEYGDHPGNVHMKKKQVQYKMGEISNLITDMTLADAPDQHLERAVKHSMVVIDAVKHKYDYKQSEKNNDIAELKKLYQRRYDADGNIHIGGAATIISAAGSVRRVPESKEGVRIIDPKTGKSLGTRYIDPETGEKLSSETGREYRVYLDPISKKRLYKDPTTGLYKTKDPNFKPIPKELAILSEPKQATKTLKAMQNTNDAMSLVSVMRNPKELAYANYANYLKAIANEARKETVGLKETKYNPSARKTYAREVESLDKKYNALQKRRSYEATADIIANENYKAWLWDEDNFYATDEQKSKEKQRLMTQARQQVGLYDRMTLEITPREWEAIQAGAIGSSKLAKLLGRADIDVIKAYATPYKSNKLTPTQINRIKTLSASGKGNAEIAEAMGINVSTVIKYLGE